MKIKIKICGLTKPSEAKYLNRNAVDYAGFVLFFPKSRRNISIECAKNIFKELNPDIKKVAVTVAPDLEQVREIEEAGFDYIQIHGDVPEGMFEKSRIPVIKAFNVKDIDKAEEYLGKDGVHAFVFDGAAPGSGKTFDWSILEKLEVDKPCLIAGGIGPENAAESLAATKAAGVDASSSVEYEGGGKDGEKIDAFVKAVRAYEVLMR